MSDNNMSFRFDLMFLRFGYWENYCSLNSFEAVQDVWAELVRGGCNPEFLQIIVTKE